MNLESLFTDLGVFVFRATVLLLFAWLAIKLARRVSAATRHLIWTSAIAGVLVLPVLAVFVPAWEVPAWDVSLETERVLWEKRPPVFDVPALDLLALDPPSNDAPLLSSLTPLESSPGWSALEPRAVVVLIWLSIAFLLLVRLAIANIRVDGWRRKTWPVEDDELLALLRRLSRAYRIERPVALLESERAGVPVTWGVIYPVIVLPAGADQWDEEKRIAVLTHELAHVKRLDAFTQLLAQLAVALLWFHPLVWMAMRRMRLEREHACDDFVLLAGGVRASHYADGLLTFARNLKDSVGAGTAALAMARRSELEGRLMAILDPVASRSAAHRARVVQITLVVLLFSVALTAFKAVPRASDDEAPQPIAWLDPAPRIDPAPEPDPVPEPDPAPRPRTRPHRTARPQSVELEMLIDVTRAAKRMTSDHEKSSLLQKIASRYIDDETLRDVYLDVAATISSDHERTRALLALPPSAEVLKSAAALSSNTNKREILERVDPELLRDPAVQRDYLRVIAAMTSDSERGNAISTLIAVRELESEVLLLLLQATKVISSNHEKAKVLVLFAETHGARDERLRGAFLEVAQTLSSNHEYRKVMTALLR